MIAPNDPEKETTAVDRGSGRSRSIWMPFVELPRYEPLGEDVDADVCVLGAGIAGLSVAYVLARAGRRVVVLEDGDSIGAGETARTTAHLSNAFDDRYFKVARLHGDEAARLTAESHSAAIDAIEMVVRRESIECGFERLDGYLFVPPGGDAERLEREYAACHEAGLREVAWAERAPLDGFDTGRCLRFPRQAQFHPMRYLAGLATAITRHGGRIFTGTHGESIEKGEVGTKDGRTVRATDVVVATNAPIQSLVALPVKQYPYRTYVIGARVPRGTVTRALYWDTADPYHYVRLHDEGPEQWLVVGGEDHKTGQDADDGEDRHRRLATWARERFPSMNGIDFTWSGQVMEPVDALAFIGKYPGKEHVWIVTGDSGNGMTHGPIAGVLLGALVQGREHPWAKLYDPGRISVRAGLEFLGENVNMAAQYAKWLTSGDYGDESDVPPGGGGVIREGLHKVAVHRDRDGRIHRMTAVCPHLGAIVTWNREEGTWDCPAHGSRFDALGKVVHGPANTDLAPADEPAGSHGKRRS